MSISNVSETIGSGRVSPGEVELILSQIESLPTLPAVAGRLLEMTGDEGAGTGEIAALVESDQSLSARVLSMARKSDVGARVETVDRAVVLLGAEAVRGIVLGVQVFETFGTTGEPASRFDRVGFWRHSLAVGCAARLMAEKRAGSAARARAARMGWPLARPEEAFVCGLLHDLGKVVFDSCFPKSYDRVIEKVEGRRADIADVEREVFGVDHAIAGHRLALHWKLPKPVAECMWLHHQSPSSTPTRIGFPDHVMLVQAADRLVRQMQLGYSGNYGTDDAATELFEATGLTPQVVDEVMRALPETIESRAEVLGLHQVTSRELLHETLIRTNAELSRLNAALSLSNRSLEQRSRALEAICELNASLGEDYRHESVAGAVVRGLQLLMPAAAAAAVVTSPARHLTIVVWAAPGEARWRVEVLPSTADLKAAGERATRVAAENVFSGPMLDRLTVLLGGQPPQYCRLIRCSGEMTAALVSAERVPDDLDRSIELIGDWAASCFKTAESTFVTRQLTEELAEINRQLIKTQGEAARMRSLAMVGEMAAGAAHELNNPLAVISGRAQLLAGGDHGEAVTRSARIIAEHAQRASDIVNELMEFAKPTPAQPTVWPVADLLNEIRQSALAQGLLSAEQFVLDISDGLPRVHADKSQMRLLFDELIRNAVEAMKDRKDPRLTVNCRADVADERLVIRIEDNGCGMTPDVVERAMDPFFSYRPAGRGRGLGLSRAARYAEINRGRIRLSSRVKEGTAVIVELPVAAAE
ncbi:MAG TPA: HDOD domain-containing protein [Phycisphaerae bacterium]|nr:HDOD domain-containing protein [Phycisphaerae bacterium]HOM53059.1 HDOD domain-containing protein [Phycisphaerae bacterium]HPP28222.1 HDOD domain-containing protein [Phycisphaerae bacterium]HPU27056.1 HDOD domain-containing protein [Phycisphaerae bacterium]HPZ97564.1 HDOD domain-containing protein [Phycisphaerae bacterium]